MLSAAHDHYSRQARLAALTVTAAQNAWAGVAPADLDGTWPAVGRRLLTLVAAGQLAAAQDAATYVAAALAEQGITARPSGLLVAPRIAGVASDGRGLDSLLLGPLVAVKVAIGQGRPVPDAVQRGRRRLTRIVATQVQDAGRAAVTVATVARPAVDGYARVVNLPACRRCVALAGDFYDWGDGFARHPVCDCRPVPSVRSAARALLTDVRATLRAGLVTDLPARAAQRLSEAPDPLAGVDALAGMASAGSVAISARGGTVRPVPEQLIREARGNRSAAIRLLARAGYLAT